MQACRNICSSRKLPFQDFKCCNYRCKWQITIFNSDLCNEKRRLVDRLDLRYAKMDLKVLDYIAAKVDVTNVIVIRRFEKEDMLIFSASEDPKVTLKRFFFRYSYNEVFGDCRVDLSYGTYKISIKAYDKSEASSESSDEEYEGYDIDGYD